MIWGYLCILGAAAMVQCLTGFGFGIFASALLPMVLPFKSAVAVLSLLSVAVNFTLGFQVRKQIRWKVLIPVVLCSFAGQTAGAKLLFSVKEGMLSKMLGIVLIGLAIFFSFFRERIRIRGTVRNGVIAGLIGGVLNTFNVGGPPVVIYYLQVCQGNLEYLATVQATFFITSVYNCVLHILWGNVTGEILQYAGAGLFIVIPVMVFGVRIFRKISQNMLNRLVYGMIAVMGLIRLAAK